MQGLSQWLGPRFYPLDTYHDVLHFMPVVYYDSKGAFSPLNDTVN